MNKYVSLYKNDATKKELLAYYDSVLDKWPIPFTEIQFETPCGKTNIIHCGNSNGRPLLLFHGTGNNSLMWRTNVVELGEHFNLFLIDTLNDTGKSEASIDFHAKTDYSKWVCEIINELHEDPVYVLGHSKGGWIALNSVIQHPANIGKAVLLSPAAGINEKLNRDFVMKSISVGLNPSEKNLTAYFRYMFAPGREVNAKYVEYLAKVIKGTKTRPIKHRRFSDDELKTIGIPMLLLFGDHEVCVDYPKVIERAKEMIHNIDARIVPDAGHGLQGENPEWVNHCIIEFLQR